MSKRRHRVLRSDEEELWRKVARTARPLQAKDKLTQTAHWPNKDDAAARLRKDAEFGIKPFQIGSRASTLLSETGDGVPREHSVQMDRKTFQKMRRGKAAPEARIDLHGMTVDAAESALTQFLFRAHSTGKRLVLVITGKGRSSADDGPMPDRPGILRRSLPLWLGRAPLASIVQQFTQAHQRHGGSGAFYVYLRRR